ncbi:MAG: MFS transporter [Chloroflexota bacterium]
MTRNSLLSFYLIIITQTLSLVGSQMTTFGLGIWLFTQTGRAAPLLLTAFFNELPGVLFGSFIGVLIDRWDRKVILILADAGQALGTLILLWSVATNNFQIWILFAVAFVQGTFAAFQNPAKDATTTLLVKEDQRDRANGIQQVAFPLAGVMAPVLAGGLYVWVGLAGIIAVDLITFIIAVVAVTIVYIPPTPARASRHPAQEFLDSFRYLNSRRPLLYFIVYLTLIHFLLNGPLGLSIPYLISITRNEAITGQLMGVMSGGAFAGAMLISIWGGTRPRMHTILIGLLITGAAFFMYAVARTPLWLAVSIFILMIPLPIMNALSTSIFQLKIPPNMQGRVFSIFSQLSLLASTSSFLITAILAETTLESGTQTSGIGMVLIVTGAIIIFVTGVAYTSSSIRRLEKVLPDY